MSFWGPSCGARCESGCGARCGSGCGSRWCRRQPHRRERVGASGALRCRPAPSEVGGRRTGGDQWKVESRRHDTGLLYCSVRRRRLTRTLTERERSQSVLRRVPSAPTASPRSPTSAAQKLLLHLWTPLPGMQPPACDVRRAQADPSAHLAVAEPTEPEMPARACMKVRIADGNAGVSCHSRSRPIRPSRRSW